LLVSASNFVAERDGATQGLMALAALYTALERHRLIYASDALWEEAAPKLAAVTTVLATVLAYV